MSTNPKELNPKESSETHIKTSKRSVDASLRNLQKEMEQEKTLVQETPVGRFQRVLAALQLARTGDEGELLGLADADGRATAGGEFDDGVRLGQDGILAFFWSVRA